VFGISAFAQAPFASLGRTGAIYDVAVAEAASAVAAYLSRADFVATDAETGTAAEAVNTINNIFNPVVAETASGAGAFTSSVSFIAAIAEAASGVSTATSQADFVAAISELAQAAATSSSQAVFQAAMLEAASGASASSGALVFAVAVSEQAAGASAQTVVAELSGTVAEAATALSALTALRTANVYLTGVQIYVQIGNALVWGEVQDDGAITWQNVNIPAPTFTWNPIVVPQTPDWDDIPS